MKRVCPVPRAAVTVGDHEARVVVRIEDFTVVGAEQHTLVPLGLPRLEIALGGGAV